ncbi:SWIM zinc finger family protein [Methanothermococcus sp. SCGC AD-155-C09]|nr:SWIM zinc finger family protein [Methanothermococcus sp. SCGC AD-155-C09]
MTYKNIYPEKIIKRGKDYYKNNLVKYCVVFKNKIYGKVIGGKLYNTIVNLEDYSGLCSCPYKYNCKHAYAIIEAYSNKNYVDGDELFNNLRKMPKEEILKILEDIIIKNNLWHEIIPKKENILEEGLSILKLIPYEKKNIYTFKSFLKNRFLKNSNDEELLELLKEIGTSEYIDEDSGHLCSIVDILAHEIFSRNNREIIEKAFKISKKYKKLWIIEEYYYDYCKGLL